MLNSLAQTEKEREEDDAYTKTYYNPIPTSLFVSDMFLLSLDEDTVGTIDAKSMFTHTMM